MGVRFTWFMFKRRAEDLFWKAVWILIVLSLSLVICSVAAGLIGAYYVR